MKTKVCLLFLLSSFTSFCQQNFINVPSCEITPAKKVFFQQQLNFDRLLQSNSTLDFGLGKGFELGVNVFGCNTDFKNKHLLYNDTGSSSSFYPLLMMNGLKLFKLGSNASIGIGAQLGHFLYSLHQGCGANLYYCNFSINNVFVKESKWVGGINYSTQKYSGKGNRAGLWMGVELPATKQVHFVFESIFGTNNMAYTSIAMVYYAKSYLPLTAGVQLPNYKGNPPSVVFELTWLPKKTKG